MKPKIRKSIVTQIGILTNDINRSKEAWERFFGLPPQPVSTSDGYEKTAAVYDGQPLHGRIYQVCFNLQNIEVELIQPVDDTPSYWKDCLDQNGPGVHHFSFAVKDMDGCVKQLGELGLTLRQQGEFPNGRYAYMDGMDTMNVVLELLEKDQEVIE
ncbi:MAG: VOC family protein [Eubacteriales bacterium]|nr:VOC family protein [Eubacteriales bacterium]